MFLLQEPTYNSAQLVSRLILRNIIVEKEYTLRSIFADALKKKNPDYLQSDGYLETQFHIYSYNSKITSPGEKTVITKNITNKISNDFSLNVIRVKHRGSGEMT